MASIMWPSRYGKIRVIKQLSLAIKESKMKKLMLSAAALTLSFASVSFAANSAGDAAKVKAAESSTTQTQSSNPSSPRKMRKSIHSAAHSSSKEKAKE